MEKASTPSNRLTRSTARNTPSKKSEDSSDLNPSEELKHNLRKSRRKTETKPRTNGDTSTDADSKRIKNYEEVSDGNSFDGCDSEDSNVSYKQQRYSPKSNNHKTPSPTISRKSLRSRRSVTPGPELDGSATRKMTRSTSEGKLDCILTPTRRSTRARSESKDFVFTPSKYNTDDNENSHSEKNSRSIPTNPVLRVIDEIIEEDGELEPHNSPKTSLTTQPLLDVGNTGCVKLNLVELDNKFTDDNKVEMCQNKTSQPVTNEDTPQISDQLPVPQEAETVNFTVNEEVETPKETSHQLPTSVDAGTVENTSDDHMPSSEKADDAKETMNQEIDTLEETSDQLQIYVNTGTPKEASDQLPVSEEAETVKGTSFRQSISKAAETPRTTSNELSEEAETSLPPDDKQRTIPFEEKDDSHNAEPFENENVNLLNHQRIPNNDEHSLIGCIETDEMNCTKESQRMSMTQSTSRDSKPVHNNGCTSEISQFKTPAIGSENISITENNNVSLTLEVQNENENLVALHHESTLISTGTKPLEDDRVEDNESVLICGSDSEEPCDEMEEIQDDIDNIYGVKISREQKSNSVFNDSREINETPTYEEVAELSISVTDQSIRKAKYSITKVQEVMPEDNNTNEIDNERQENKSPVNDITEIHDNYSDTLVQAENIEFNQKTSHDNQEFTQYCISRSLNVEIVEEAKSLVELMEEEENLKRTKKKDAMIDQEENSVDDSSQILDKQSNSLLRENKEQDPFEDETIHGDSASDSELYKDMSDFGSDIDEKKDDSNNDDSASSELRSGDSEEYVSSFDGEEDEEETNNEKNPPSNEQVTAENGQKNIGSKVADTNSPMTYDKALAILNKDRVNKIDDEEFFDMFTEELNRVSEESGSDSDIAIVDEYIAEPEEQQQKSNKKQGNLQANLKTLQRPAPPHSIPNRPMPSSQKFVRGYNQLAPTPIRVNLKTSQKSVSSPNSISQNLSGAYHQQGPIEHSHQSMSRTNFSQGGLYRQYNQGMTPLDSSRVPVIYDQFDPMSTSMQDPRMFQPQVSPDNFPTLGMFSHPSGSVSDAQMIYSGGPSFKVRSIETMCGSQPPNAINFNAAGPVTRMRNINENENSDRIMGISAATMTESGENQGASFRSSPEKSDAVTNPILELLGLDKRRLKMLKKVLGLDESHKKQRNKIKQILMEEAQKMGLSFKSSAGIEKHIQREQRQSAELAAQMKARKKQLMKQIVDSDSSFINYFAGSRSEHSSDESDARSEQTSSGVSKQDHSYSESSNEMEEGKRQINLEDGGVSVTIDTRPKRKLRHRASKDIPMVSIDRSSERKRSYQSCESSDEEHIKQMRKKKQEDLIFISSGSFVKKTQQRKMTQGKRQMKKKSSVLQSNSGTFTVDPVTATSQSESDALSQDDESTIYVEKMKKHMKKELASGKNKLSNMFSQHSLREGKKGLKRKVEAAFELSEQVEPQVTKSKRLPADLLAKLGNEGKKTKKRKEDPSTDSQSEAELSATRRKPRNRATSRKLRVPSVAAHKEYIPLVMAGPTQFGLQRLDKDGTLTAAEKAAKFRSDRLYGSSVKRITSQELLNAKKKQQRNELAAKKLMMKNAGKKSK